MSTLAGVFKIPENAGLLGKSPQLKYTTVHYQQLKYSRTLTHKELGTESNK
jgi:hypothetical protein